jgi:5-methyltetrahydropteroyltriglutamate--homocysteine methyltransferase
MPETYRADHVGSLLRPPELLQARAAFDAGRIDRAELCAAEDRSILQAIALQREIGLPVVSDGEYRRQIFWEPLTAAHIEGLIPDPDGGRGAEVSRANWQGPSAGLARDMMAGIRDNRMVVGAKLKAGRLTAEESGFLSRHAGGPWKMTLPGMMVFMAGWTSWYKPGLSDRYYPTRAALFDELIGFVNRDIEALLGEGCAYVQLDSLQYVIQLGSPRFRAMLAANGEDPDALLDVLIDADNRTVGAFRGRPGVTVGLHMCRGNNRSAWLAEGGYEVAERAFERLNVDRFLLEYDTERCGSFEPLRSIPKDRTVVLGLISSKDPRLESMDLLKRRVAEAARYFPMENLAISPQCGFASTSLGNLLSWDDQRRKLELVVKAADEIWH